MAAITPTAHTLPYGSGAELYLAFELETTPGVPANVAASLAYLAVEADQVNFTFDPGRTVLELATGNQFLDYIQVEYQAKGTGSFEIPMFPTSEIYNLLAGCGLVNGASSTAGPLLLPSYITFYVGRVLAEEIYAGCRCKMITFTASATVPVKVKLDFEFIARPVVSVFVTTSGYGLTPNDGPFNPVLSFTSGVHALGAGFHEGGLNQPAWPTAFTGGGAQIPPYMWSGLQQVDLLAATNVGSPTFTASTDGPYTDQAGAAYSYDLPTPISQLDSLEITITTNLISFYGNHQNNLPSALIPAGQSVAGKFSRLFTDFAEYLLFNEVCSATGPLKFEFLSGCLGSGDASLTLLIPAAFYAKQDFKNPQKGAITEDYEWSSIKDYSSPTGSPITYKNIIAS